MTDDEINAAIAEHVGWTNVRVIHPHPRRGDQVPMLTGSPSPTSKDRSVIIPNYCQDLNAMHEVEKFLIQNADTGYEYDCELNTVCETWEDGIMNYMRLWHSTARQRAEAFLKTVGKWREQ